jgi:hypothetical protein
MSCLERPRTNAQVLVPVNFVAYYTFTVSSNTVSTVLQDGVPFYDTIRTNRSSHL